MKKFQPLHCIPLVYIPAIEILFCILALSKDNDLDRLAISEAIKNGDQKAFRTFFDRHYPGLYRFMRSRGMSHDEAEDLVQKAFVMIWEKRAGIDETKSLRAYLFQIAYSRMLNHIEYHSKFKDEDPPDDAVNIDNPETDADYSELLKQIKKNITSMPEKRAMVFELCFMKQFTYKETAESMNVSVKTVENHMALAFKDMRSALTNVYGEELLNSFKT
ncbi:MAG: RNA polymerase sigma-70 factor [Balneolales bacterium]